MSGPIRLIVCVGPRCDAEGRGRALLAQTETALKENFSEALAEGRLELATRDCLRLCTRDPVVRLEPSGEARSGPDIGQLLRDIEGELAREKLRAPPLPS
ncbi:MAG: (2Fe-2S) ferredoxin domain-containing protein [Hyphomicrobiales bacterium]|nr:MAG: (2Fe-2S) ferredoxin domain-containing protein [Hyphomicrobiales bacterium]